MQSAPPIAYFFVYFEDPASYVWRMTVGHVFHCEDLAILLGPCVLWPEGGIDLLGQK